VKLNNVPDKEEIMKNRKRLSTLENQKVFMNDDISKWEKEIQENIRKKVKEELTPGNRVKMGFQKLIIND
jgi:hypothetical protein